MKKKMFVLCFICFLVDQISKKLVIDFLTEDFIIIEGFFKLEKVYNTGGAWGILSSNTYLITIISFLFMALLIRYIYTSKITKLEAITYSLLIGGISGNLFDRLFRNKVIDFLSFKIFGYDYPVFNIADILIVISALMLIIIIFKENKSESRDRRRQKSR